MFVLTKCVVERNKLCTYVVPIFDFRGPGVVWKEAANVVSRSLGDHRALVTIGLEELPRIIVHKLG